MGVFFIVVDGLIEIYNRIWNRVNDSVKKEVDCEPTYNKKFLKTRIRSYGQKATDFYDK